MSNAKIMTERRTLASRASRVLAVATALTLQLHAASALSTQVRDVVLLRNGHEMTGRIQAETRDGLSLVLQHNLTTKLRWEHVDDIQYDAPDAFNDALEAAAHGASPEALAAFTDLLDSKTLRRPLRQEALFRIADLQRRLGRPEQALPSYEALLEAYPLGRYLDQAVTGVVECGLATGKSDAALQALDRIESAAADDEHLAALLHLLRADVAMTKGRLADARAEYEAALRSEQAAPDVGASARLGLARILHADGRDDEWRDATRSLVAADVPAQVLAGAWNDLADEALERGIRERDGDVINEALLKYLRGVVQYVPEDGDATVEHERAVAGAAKAFDCLSQLATDPTARARYRQRAAAMLDRLPSPRAGDAD